MNRTTHTQPKPVRVAASLDVQAVERELNRLWMESAGGHSAGDDEEVEGAVMRARVLNLMVYISSEEALESVNRLLSEISMMHPCRALVMVAERTREDRDIEMFVSSHCRPGDDEGVSLCCEQVTMTARGVFAVELPSAAEPLLVPDLPVFLWWRDQPRLGDEVFRKLSHASDRVILDSADFLQPYEDLLALNTLLERERAEHTGLSDLNWARLTSWRGLLANLYDVREYREALDNLSRVRVEYVAPEGQPDKIAPKALILAGWLISRLKWRVVPQTGDAETGEAETANRRTVRVSSGAREIVLEFESVERDRAEMHGWIARVELTADVPAQATFIVKRSPDGRFLETESVTGAGRSATRLLVGGDKTEGQLVQSELGILRHDLIYEEAVDGAVLLLLALFPELQ